MSVDPAARVRVARSRLSIDVTIWFERLANVDEIDEMSPMSAFRSSPRPPNPSAPVLTSVARSVELTAPSRVTAESATNSSSGASPVSCGAMTSPLRRHGHRSGATPSFGRSSMNFSPSRAVVRMIARDCFGRRTPGLTCIVTLALKSLVSLIERTCPMRTSATWTPCRDCRSPTSLNVAVSE